MEEILRNTLKNVNQFRLLATQTLAVEGRTFNLALESRYDFARMPLSDFPVFLADLRRGILLFNYSSTSWALNRTLYVDSSDLRRHRDGTQVLVWPHNNRAVCFKTLAQAITTTIRSSALDKFAD